MDRNDAKVSPKTTVAEMEFLQEVQRRYNLGETYWKENKELSEQDLEFLHGKQWPSEVLAERAADKRPCLVNNVLPTFVDQVLGDQRQNRPSIKVRPVGLTSVPSKNPKEKPAELRIPSLTGSDDYSIAEVFTSLIRNIEYQSQAKSQYDMAYQAAVEGAIGWLRVIPTFKSDTSLDQEPRIKWIKSHFAVTVDPTAEELDYSDANWIFIEGSMPKSSFQKLYPDVATEAQSAELQAQKGEDNVRIFEYMTREPYKSELVLMSNNKTYEVTEDFEKIVDELADQGITEARRRTVIRYKVLWRKITMHAVLEGPHELPCSTIPAVPVLGKSAFLRNRTIFRSLHRYAHDAQRMANYWDSAATETAALQPKSPYIASAEQIEGYEAMWRTANTKNHDVLIYNPLSPGDPGPRRQQATQVPNAELAMGMQSVDKIKATLGMFDASIGNQGNETSGRAIIARQRQGDRGSFSFIDNLTKAIQRVGLILIEMVPKLYDSERVERLLFEDGTEDFVRLNESIIDNETGEVITINDLSVAQCDVIVDTGPAYSTQRQEAAENMLEFIKAVPGAAQAMGDLVAGAMDWPKADIISARLKKLVPPDMLSADEREELQKDQTAPEISPEQQVQMFELETRKAEAEADKVKADAQVQKAQLDLQVAQLKAQAESMDLKEMVADTVAQALAELIQSRQAPMQQMQAIT